MRSEPTIYAGTEATRRQQWPPASLLTMLFSGGLLAAVAAREARATGRRWPWVLIGIAGVAIAATTAATMAGHSEVFR